MSKSDTQIVSFHPTLFDFFTLPKVTLELIVKPSGGVLGYTHVAFIGEKSLHRSELYLNKIVTPYNYTRSYAVHLFYNPGRCFINTSDHYRLETGAQLARMGEEGRGVRIQQVQCEQTHYQWTL